SRTGELQHEHRIEVRDHEGVPDRICILEDYLDLLAAAGMNDSRCETVHLALASESRSLFHEYPPGRPRVRTGRCERAVLIELVRVSTRISGGGGLSERACGVRYPVASRLLVLRALGVVFAGRVEDRRVEDGHLATVVVGVEEALEVGGDSGEAV